MQLKTVHQTAAAYAQKKLRRGILLHILFGQALWPVLMPLPAQLLRRRFSRPLILVDSHRTSLQLLLWWGTSSEAC